MERVKLTSTRNRKRKHVKCPDMIKAPVESFFSSSKIDWTSIQIKKEKNGDLAILYTEVK